MHIIKNLKPSFKINEHEMQHAQGIQPPVLQQTKSWKYLEITVEFSEAVKYAQQDTTCSSSRKLMEQMGLFLKQGTKLLIHVKVSMSLKQNINGVELRDFPHTPPFQYFTSMRHKLDVFKSLEPSITANQSVCSQSGISLSDDAKAIQKSVFKVSSPDTLFHVFL